METSRSKVQSKLVLTQVTVTECGSFFLDPDQFRSRIYFVRIMLTLPWSRFGLYLYFMDPDGDIPIQSAVRIMLT